MTTVGAWRASDGHEGKEFFILSPTGSPSHGPALEHCDANGIHGQVLWLVPAGLDLPKTAA